MYLGQRHGEQTSKLVSESKITDVLNGSGKEKFTDWSCYNCSFSKGIKPFGARVSLGFDLNVHFAGNSPAACPESPAAAKVSSSVMRK